MKRIYLITVLVFFAVSSLSAQSSSATGSPGERLELSLQQAIEIALNENPTIKVANLEIERQDYVRKETAGNLYPALSATGSYNRAIIHQKMSREGLSFGADNTFTGTANLTVPLFAPTVYASLRLNRLQMESAVEAARTSKINMVNEVKKTYYQILLAEQSLTVLEESKEMIQQTVDNTKIMYESGLAAEYDLLTAQVQLSNLEPNIIQTRTSIDISKMLLKMYLSIPQEMDIAVQGSLDGFTTDVMMGNNGYGIDVTNNSDLRNLDIQRKMLEQQIKIINTQRMPTIAAFGTATITGNDMGDLNFMSPGGNLDPTKYPILTQHPDLLQLFGDMFGGGGNATPATGFWWQNPVAVGVQISIPIFSGFKNTNKVKQTRNSIAQIDYQRDYLEQSIKMQIQASINNLMTAREKMYANEKTVAQAQKAHVIAEARFQGGTGTILELNSAQISLTQAQLNYSQAIYEFLSAEADYEKAIGRDYWGE